MGALQPPLNSPRFECGLNIRKFPGTLRLKKRHTKSLSVIGSIWFNSCPRDVDQVAYIYFRNKIKSFFYRIFTRLLLIISRCNVEMDDFFVEYLIVLKVDAW